MGVFKIDAYDFEWITGAKDDPQDLCLHGRVVVQFGDTVIEDHGTVSATALLLLKTLTGDKVMAPFDIQMIPCCGHSIFANEELTEVTISGCNMGTDWTTLHEGDTVRLIPPSGQEEIVSLPDYRVQVLRFTKRLPGRSHTSAASRDGRGARSLWRIRVDRTRTGASPS